MWCPGLPRVVCVRGLFLHRGNSRAQGELYRALAFCSCAPLTTVPDKWKYHALVARFSAGQAVCFGKCKIWKVVCDGDGDGDRNNDNRIHLMTTLKLGYY